jgi:SARP family transcriptional regulator, regulator of embCAB operon
VLLSKLRHGLGADRLRGRTGVELLLPPATFVDVEAALEGAHRAESCIAEGRWAQAWGPAGIAYHVATRPFLTGLDAPWIDQRRRRLEEVRLRGLECFAAAGLGLGGPALAQAEERARMLTELAPYRETGYQILMEALERGERGVPSCDPTSLQDPNPLIYILSFRSQGDKASAP